MNVDERSGWTDRFAYVFNRTALGLGVLFGAWMVIEGDWLRVAAVIGLIGVYFALHRLFDAP